MKSIIPTKLRRGDEVRVIAPATSMSVLDKEERLIISKRFEDLGLKITFGKHVNKSDDFKSSSVESRIEDLHEAFLDSMVKAILPVIGGYNSNQLLRYLDYDLIAKNPKIFCGMSDITTLLNTFFTKTGLITYHGPIYSSFEEKYHFEYTLDYFKKCLLDNSNESFELMPSEEWSDDEWYKNQNNRKLYTNEGYWVINKGVANGTIIGGNLCTLNLLQGTEYFPSLSNTILFIEDDYEVNAAIFDRDLQSLLHQQGSNEIKGIIIGRFQKASKVSRSLLEQIIKGKKQLQDIPVLANIDFGHTQPMVTFPIGGECYINTTIASPTIKITLY